MAIIRAKRDKNFSIFDNKLLRDSEISFKARGLLTYMLSMPDNWKFYVSELATHSKKEGESAIRSAIEELEKAGYMKRVRQRGEKGRFSSVDWYVYDEPKFSPHSDFPHVDKPHVEEPQVDNRPLPRTNSIKNLKKEELNKIDRQIDSVAVIRDFVDFWETNLGFMAPLIQEDFLYEYQDWREKGVEHDEIIAIFKEALSKTISYNANNKRKYTLGILHGWLNTNTLSLNAIKGEEKQFKEQQEKKQQRNNVGYNNSYTNKSNEAW